MSKSDEQAEPYGSTSVSNGLALCTDIIPRHVLLAIVLADSNMIDIVLLTLYCTTSHSCSCHSQSCTNHVTKLAIILATSYSLSFSSRLTHSHSHHVLLAIIHAASIIIAILLIVVILIVSCRICQLSFVSNT